jgi:hypothetical protein
LAKGMWSTSPRSGSDGPDLLADCTATYASYGNIVSSLQLTESDLR